MANTGIYAPDGSWYVDDTDTAGAGLHTPEGKLRLKRTTTANGYYDPTGGIYFEETNDLALGGFYNNRGNLRVVRSESFGPTQGLYAANGAIRVKGLAAGPEEFEAISRTSFGTPAVSTDPAIFSYFKLQHSTMDNHAYVSGSTVRTTVDVGEVASGDPATVERTEWDTLTRLEPQIGGNPSLSMDFDLWIPTNAHIPGASSSLVVAQMKITAADATQLIFHSSGTLRIRAYNGTSYTQTVVIPAGSVKGQWHRIQMKGIHSKTSAGQMEIWVDGYLKYSRYNGTNIGLSPGDTEKVYLKFGTYRTGVDTDPTRGLASVWVKDLTAYTTWTGP